MKIKNRAIVALLLFFCALPAFADNSETLTLNAGETEISLTVVNEDALKGGTRPKIGLVLSGGGAKGSAHIGVLKVIEEVGIPIDYVAGTSMGSIIGGLYALGYSPSIMERIISHITWSVYISDKIPNDRFSFQEKARKSQFILDVPFSTAKIDTLSFLQSLPSGIVSGNNLENLFNALAIGYNGNIDFNNLPIPFACVATDLVSGQEVVFRKGNLPQAIRASMSIPGLFAPVRLDNMVLVDGGILNNIPVDVCRDMGADIIISVMVGAEVYTDSSKLQSILGVLGRLLGVVTYNTTTKNISDSDYYIKPDLSGNGILSFNQESINQLIKNGYSAADAHRGELMLLKRTLDQYGDSEPHLNAPRASFALFGQFKIADVQMVGVSEKEEKWLMWKSGLDKVIGKVIGGHELDNMIMQLYGLNNFSKVKYSLEEDQLTHEYNVLVEFTQKAPHSVKLAMHFDNMEASAFAVQVALNSHRIVSPQLEVTGKLGYNPGVTVKGSYGMRYVPKINISYSLKKSEFPLQQAGNHVANAKVLRHNAKLYLSGLYTRNFDAEFGLEFEQFTKGHLFVEGDVTLPTEGKSTPYLGLFAKFAVDTRDELVLPKKGVLMDIGSHWRFKDLSKKTATEPVADAYIKLKSYITLSDIFVLSPNFYYRAVMGNGYYQAMQKAGIIDCYDIVYNNIIGGEMPGRHLEQLMPFVGVTKPELMNDYTAIGLAELRCNVYGMHHISAIGSILRTSNTFMNMFRPSVYSNVDYGYLSAENYWGAGLRYTAKLPTGPGMVEVAYSNLSKRVSVYFSLGVDF
ncbi:MAG: patatin-like phospholipase family protein [Bacteroidales bacterium]|nr:patatin-like phospholipase family protein [Bacteroidales bacterium]